MNIKPRSIWFLVSILVALIINLGATGSHVYNPGNRVFWIDPFTTTLPYVALLVITLRYLSKHEKNNLGIVQPVCAYIGSWISMVIFTFWLISLEPGPRHSSTMGIAILFTPMFFLASAIPGYMVGWVFGSFMNSEKGIRD